MRILCATFLLSHAGGGVLRHRAGSRFDSRSGMERDLRRGIQSVVARRAFHTPDDLKLKFNHGIVTGTYSSISAEPDPYYGRIVQVTGTVTSGNIYLASAASADIPCEREDREGRHDLRHRQLER